MKQEDRTKLRKFASDVSGLKSRTPDEKKFSDWRKDVEKKLEEAFGKNSEEVSRFKRIKFFDFEGGDRSKSDSLSESELKEYLRGLDQARNLLHRFVG